MVINLLLSIVTVFLPIIIIIKHNSISVTNVFGYLVRYISSMKLIVPYTIVCAVKYNSVSCIA